MKIGAPGSYEHMSVETNAKPQAILRRLITVVESAEWLLAPIGLFNAQCSLKALH